jgi:hypothetical protein
MTVSPDDVALAAVLGGTLLGAMKLRRADRADERKARKQNDDAERRHALALAKAGES